MRVFIFEGTKEEFDAVLPYLEGLASAASDLPDGYSEPKAVSQELSIEDARSVLTYHGGLGSSQKDVFRFLFDHEEEVAAAEIKQHYGWSPAEFRGAVANIPRREEGAVGRRVGLIGQRWDPDEEQNYYWLKDVTRQAFAEVYAEEL